MEPWLPKSHWLLSHATTSRGATSIRRYQRSVAHKLMCFPAPFHAHKTSTASRTTAKSLPSTLKHHHY
eukprot:35010-Eustigmatos_ZCMA.PRE.1